MVSLKRGNMSTLNDMLETALWSTIDYENGDLMLDARYSIDDISEDFKEKCQSVINKFILDATDHLTQDELNNSPIGHDLWLTIHGHGAGFWDGDYKNGEKLTEICKQFEKLGLEDDLQGSLKER